MSNGVCGIDQGITASRHDDGGDDSVGPRTPRRKAAAKAASILAAVSRDSAGREGDGFSGGESVEAFDPTGASEDETISDEGGEGELL